MANGFSRRLGFAKPSAVASARLPEVSDEITTEELEAAMAAGVDEDGNDLQLAKWVASLTEEERRESEENLRRWIRSARGSLEGARNDEPAGKV